LASYNIIYVCQQLTSRKSIVVHFVDKKHTEFGIDEQIIEIVCRKKLVQATCIQMTPTRFEMEWIMLTKTILQRDDYGKDICLFYERPFISLFGLPHIVSILQQQFDSINKNDKTMQNLVSVVKPQVG
jgi:diaminopimelate epimerase